MLGRSTATATFISISSEEVQVVCADFSATPAPARLSRPRRPAPRVTSPAQYLRASLTGEHPGAFSDQTVSSCLVPPRIERPGLGRTMDRPYRRELDGA